MSTNTLSHDAFVKEFTLHLSGYNDQDLARFFSQMMIFINRFVAGCELEGPLYLVLDNSVIQDFKHRHKRPESAIKSLAFTAFCRFVTGWSGRNSFLAVSPVAVYEHLGRQICGNAIDAGVAFSEVRRFLVATQLPIVTLGFDGQEALLYALHKVAADDAYLTRLAKEIDDSDWQVDLKAPFGVKIPISIASNAIPDNLPLQYFDPWYVKFTFISRIERLIIKQSRHNPEAMPIGSGEMSVALADLNKVRHGVLKGIGDIDLLQLCDVCSQYQQKLGYVLLGQTFDKGLNDVLTKRHVFSESAGVDFGEPEVEKRVADMVNFMFSKPFAAHEARRNSILPDLLSFFDTVNAVCAHGKLIAD